MAEDFFCPLCLKVFGSSSEIGNSLSNCRTCKTSLRKNLGEVEIKQFHKEILGQIDGTRISSLALKRYTKNKIALALGVVFGFLILVPSLLYASRFLKDREIRTELARQVEYEFQRDLREVNYSINTKNKISSNLLKKPAAFWLKVLIQGDKEQEALAKIMLARLGNGSRQEILSLFDSNDHNSVLKGLEIIQLMLVDSARQFQNEAIRFAQHDDAAIKKAAIVALLEMKPNDRRLLPSLFNLGANGTKEFRDILNYILVNLGPYGEAEIQPYLKHLNTNADPAFKLQSLLLLNRSNVDPSGYQADLTQCLKDRDLEIKRASATALSKVLKSKPLQVLPVLLPALADQDRETYDIIRGGINLVQLNSTSNLDFLPALLTEKNDPRTRQQGWELVAKIPYFKWANYIPLMKSALDSKEIKLQHAALLATNIAGKEAVELSPTLKEIVTVHGIL